MVLKLKNSGVTPENRPQVPSAGAPEMRVIEKELC